MAYFLYVVYFVCDMCVCVCMVANIKKINKKIKNKIKLFFSKFWKNTVNETET